MDFLEFIKAIFYGIVEGITEWLPVSSTGHLILFEEFFGFSASESFIDMFRVVIQLGAIFAVIILFWGKLFPFSKSKSSDEKKGIFITWGKVIIACLPAAVIGLLLDDWLDKHFYNFPTVATTLIIYGLAFLLVEYLNKKGTLKVKADSVEKLSFKKAFGIGVFQLLSLIPGTSRSGSTILGGMILGANRSAAAEFSFFLAIPVMFGASFLKVLKFGLDIAEGEASMLSGTEIGILIVGCISAFLVSLAAIKFLMDFIKKHDFKLFGYYRIILGIILLIYYFAR